MSLLGRFGDLLIFNKCVSSANGKLGNILWQD